MIRCFIGIGSNLSDPKAQVLAAAAALKQLPASQFVALSPLYQSTPLSEHPSTGSLEQPNYINAVVAIDTQLTALDLLDHTQYIEQQQGRVRSENRWGPRTLDLDILLYGDQQIDHQRLTVPHYGLAEREFVVYPLYDLQPTLVLPNGCKLVDLLAKTPINGMTKHLI